MGEINVKPTESQRKTFELKMQNPDMPLGTAMRLGGYTKKTASHPKKDFLDSRGVAVLREEYKNHLSGLGLGTAKIAQKMAEWLDAQKPFSSHTEPDRLVPDYQTQIKAGELLRQDLGIVEDKGQNNVMVGEMIVNVVSYDKSE